MSEPKMNDKLRCPCGSVWFMRCEQISTSSPHPQFWEKIAYLIRCIKPTCDHTFIWNFTHQRWDPGAEPRPIEQSITHYFRSRGKF